MVPSENVSPGKERRRETTHICRIAATGDRAGPHLRARFSSPPKYGVIHPTHSLPRPTLLLDLSDSHHEPLPRYIQCLEVPPRESLRHLLQLLPHLV